MVESKLTSISVTANELFKEGAQVAGYPSVPVYIALKVKELYDAEKRKQLIESLVREGR